ncbi:MAG TPA: lantibiotic dehydratase [Candidatus Dormibacteraeota bacterium]|jgi:thiopeptide-type bacteriocin biosynthesis protein|nr:lantibiotic dehydratase [Candidatus Dormibacteraeota bacterium]
MSLEAKLRPAGFFALRTPLLPISEFLDWGEGLAAPAAPEGDRAAALKADRQTLRARLRELIARPEVREALFVASPDLDSALAAWEADPESENGTRAERSLVRYFSRMCTRPTPFGLFAGCSVGTTGDETTLELGPRSTYRRHVRLDMEYVAGLVSNLETDTQIRERLHWRPNSSIYRAAGRLRYVEARFRNKQRQHRLVAVEDSDYLNATLGRAAAGATRQELAQALVEPDISIEEALGFVDELIDSQLLVSDLEPEITGEEPVGILVRRLAAIPEAELVAKTMDAAEKWLERREEEPPGTPPAEYRALAESLGELPAPVELNRLFQLDLVKPVERATVGPEVLSEVERVIRMLYRLRGGGGGRDGLSAFRDAFRERYESTEVPLNLVLDEEVGIGFDRSNAPGAEASPLLQGINFPGSMDESVRWRALQSLTLRKLSEAYREGRDEIAITNADLDALPAPGNVPLPRSLSCVVEVARGEAGQGKTRMYYHGAFGPSGARLLGRFCHADPELERQVGEHLREEEAGSPEAIFAEVVHLPEGRIGNIVMRPVLRQYEIAYLGRSGAPAEMQIGVDDIMVAVAGDRVVLRSKRLNREIVPRLSSAHNYGLRSVGIYRFLCALQMQGVNSDLGWDWGPFQGAPFLPRVVSGNTVLSRARWNVPRDEIKKLDLPTPDARFGAAQEMRARLSMPRWVAVSDADNELWVDFDNALSVETFVQLLKKRPQVTLVEPFASRETLIAEGPEGTFTNELVIPLTAIPTPPAEAKGGKAGRGAPVPAEANGRAEHPAGEVVAAPAAEPAMTESAWENPAERRLLIQTDVRRTYAPGSEWLYLKLYCGTSTADALLRDVLAPLTRQAIATGAADSWFFIRYADPDWHLRLRLHGDPRRLLGEFLPNLEATLEPLLRDHTVSRLMLDTYQRELERYGPSSMDVCEQLFWADSEAVLSIVELLAGDAGMDARWKLGLRGSDQLLTALGLDAEAKRTLLRRLRDSYRREFGDDGGLRKQVADRYRGLTAEVQNLIDPGWDGGEIAPGIQILDARNAALAGPVARIHELREKGQLMIPLPDLGASLVHMHLNRLLRSAARAQELVIYDFLDRLYLSRAART